MGGCSSCNPKFITNPKLCLEVGLFEDTKPKKIPVEALHLNSFASFLETNLKSEFKKLPIQFEPKLNSDLLRKIGAGEQIKITGTVKNSWKLKLAILTDHGTRPIVLFVSKGIAVSAVEKHIKKCLNQPEAPVYLTYRSVKLMSDDFLIEYCSPPYSKLIAVSCCITSSKLFSQIAYLVPWKVLVPGLNFEAICTNSHCCAYEQTVYIQRGRGCFNMEGEQYQSYHCPVCADEVKLISFGVTLCRYSYTLHSDATQIRSFSNNERSTQYSKLEEFSELHLRTAQLEALKL